MSIQIDDRKAKEIFIKAIAESKKPGFVPSTHYKDKIEQIILGTHLTYRYILITGLLGKATNNSIDPICLQAGSELPGAYDARSLCHGVIVQIERDELAKKLGASNEPFLNKPARYKELSTSNAVRRGNDKLILSLSIEVLSSLKNSEDAYSSLVDACHFIGKRDGRAIDLNP